MPGPARNRGSACTPRRAGVVGLDPGALGVHGGAGGRPDALGCRNATLSACPRRALGLVALLLPRAHAGLLPADRREHAALAMTTNARTVTRLMRQRSANGLAWVGLGSSPPPGAPRCRARRRLTSSSPGRRRLGGDGKARRVRVRPAAGRNPLVAAVRMHSSKTPESKSRTVTSSMPSVVRPPGRVTIRWAGTERSRFACAAHSDSSRRRSASVAPGRSQRAPVAHAALPRATRIRTGTRHMA